MPFFSAEPPNGPNTCTLDDQTAELKDASDLWGLDAIETETRLKERHGNRAQVACIGPAGEKLSLISGIVTDRGRIAARSGLGAVMGSKKLKAVVAAGTRRVGVFDRPRINRLSREFQKRISAKKGLERFLTDGLLGTMGKITRRSRIYPRQPADLWRLLLRKFGTTALTAMSAENGDSPIKNWSGVGHPRFSPFPVPEDRGRGRAPVRDQEIRLFFLSPSLRRIHENRRGPLPHPGNA